MDVKPKVGVGVGVIIIKDNKILLGRRKNALGAGTWQSPGGHLEFNETYEECAERETMEEAGIKIKNIRFFTATNDIFDKDNKHYVTIFMVSEYDSGEVKIMEPDRCENWNWFDWNNLPQPLFIPVQNLIKGNYNPLG
ncbi:MAG: NUDIX domain-containing protein [Candidatus Aenigmarchaeota archaeon]|nr:NUDIX domain-containing protein [Candidatus Aenigmarchaeota archaeon]